MLVFVAEEYFNAHFELSPARFGHFERLAKNLCKKQNIYIAKMVIIREVTFMGKTNLSGARRRKGGVRI